MIARYEVKLGIKVTHSQSNLQRDPASEGNIFTNILPNRTNTKNLDSESPTVNLIISCTKRENKLVPS